MVGTVFQNKSVAIQKYCTDLMTLPNKAPLLANFKQILNVEIVVGFQIVFIHPLVRVHFKIENHTQLLECRYT